MNRALILSLALGLVAAAMAQDEVRRAGAHEHSVAAGQLAVERGRLDLMLRIPGSNLVGFEHPPRSDEQAARLRAARERLAAGDWLVLPGSAGCEPAVDLSLPGFAADRDERASRRGDDHEHGHDHEHGVGHAEFRVTVEADCADRPDWVELRLFEGWPDNRLIRIDAITETRQLRSDLTADAPRLELR